MTTSTSGAWWCVLVALAPLSARAGDGACREFMRHTSACTRDSDCTVVRLGCNDRAVSKAELSAALKAAKGCDSSACPMVESATAIPICEQARCVMRPSPGGNPMEACLERHVERFPDDRAPVSVQVTPLPSIGAARPAVTATATGDSREVARCLEDVLTRLATSEKATTVQFVPGVPLPQAERPRVVAPVYHPTTRPEPIRVERVQPRPTPSEQ